MRMMLVGAGAVGESMLKILNGVIQKESGCLMYW